MLKVALNYRETAPFQGTEIRFITHVVRRFDTRLLWVRHRRLIVREIGSPWEVQEWDSYLNDWRLVRRYRSPIAAMKFFIQAGDD